MAGKWTARRRDPRLMQDRSTVDVLAGFDNRRRAFVIASFLAVTTALAAIRVASAGRG